MVYNPGKQYRGPDALPQHPGSDLVGSINTNTEYLLDTIRELITPYDEHINEQQKDYIEMISTNTLNELGNIITLNGKNQSQH